MKTMGVWADFLYCRIRPAVSSPSMSGMLTSSRMTANSISRMYFRASCPDRALTMFCPSSSRIVLNTTCFSGRSSTTRMLTFSGASCRATTFVTASPTLLLQPGPQHRQQVRRVHRFGQVVPGAGLDALLAVALHGLGRHRDHRQIPPLRELADFLHGGHAIHLRH